MSSSSYADTTDAEFWSSKPSSPDSVFSSEGMMSDYTSESNDLIGFKMLDVDGIQLQAPSILMDLASRYSIQVRSRSPLEDVCGHQFEDQRSSSNKKSSAVSMAQPKRRGQLPKCNTQANQSGRYKTELCRQWEELGFCEYADRCLFAHGEEEIKPLPNRHPKYKTEKCVAFHEQGFCSFGPRCSFIHTKPDPKSIIEEVLKKVSAMNDIPAGNMEDNMEDHGRYEGPSFEFLSGKAKPTPDKLLIITKSTTKNATKV